jgi:hypothetical protein
MTNKTIFKKWVCFEISNGCGPKKKFKYFSMKNWGLHVELNFLYILVGRDILQ